MIVTFIKVEIKRFIALIDADIPPCGFEFCIVDEFVILGCKVGGKAGLIDCCL